MGQAGAQREPSMEEILASIRRIIENNEPALDGGDGEANAHHLTAMTSIEMMTLRTKRSTRSKTMNRQSGR